LGPNITLKPFSSKSDIPIEVINKVILDEFLRGLYAIFSIIIPKSALPIIAIIKVGINPKFKFFTAKNPKKAPAIYMSPWAKFISFTMPYTIVYPIAIKA
jgi:hypothetical protein